MDDAEMEPTESESPSTEPAPTTSASPGLLQIGALILVGVWLVFDILIDAYGISDVAVVLAVLVLAVPRLGFVAAIAPPEALSKLLGYAIGIFGVIEIVTDLRFASSILDSGVEIIAALAGYAGYVLSFLGARAVDA